MPGFLGTQILDPVNVVVAMTLYTLALLVRTVADGLGACPTTSARPRPPWATAGCARFFAVELPLAVPVISAGLRVAAVSNVSIVSVAAHHRRRPARLAVHRRLQPRLLRPDRRRHRRLRRAGAAVRRRHRRWPPGCSRRGSARRRARHERRSIGWLTDPAHWTGSDGIPTRLLEHLGYSCDRAAGRRADRHPARALAIGHTGRGRFVVVNLAGAARALPEPGPALPRGAAGSAQAARRLWPTSSRASSCWWCSPIPPILAGAYAGVEGVDPAARDAAKGMGMTGAQVLAQGRGARARCR